MVDELMEKTAIIDAQSDSDDFDNETSSENIRDSIGSETLIMTCHNIVTLWHRVGLTTAQRFPALKVDWSPCYDLQNSNLLPLDIFRQTSRGPSGLQLVADNIVQGWQSRLKMTSSNGHSEDLSGAGEDFADIADVEPSHVTNTGLRPTLESDLENVQNSSVVLGDNPSASAVLDAVANEFPLNRKQRLVAKRIIQGALTWKDYPYDSAKRDQLLMYIAGEGGTGKSQIIKAIVAGLRILKRDHEIILLAPTGAAADNIGGNTIHTALGMTIGSKQNRTPPQRIQRLWATKTIMVVDEVSMVDLQTLAKINNRCKVARSQSPDSPELFGGLPIVVFMGDFYQFPPVKGLPLWRQPRDKKEEEVQGKEIWNRFTDVIILDQQMRQAEDLPFRNLLQRARQARLSNDDINLLNSKCISADTSFPLHSLTCIVRTNYLRHCLNHVSLIQFARSRGQRIYIFPADHSRLPPAQNLALEDIFSQQDEGVSIPSQGLFLYTAEMPCMVLANISSVLGLVNGSRGTAARIIVDAESKFDLLSRQQKTPEFFG
jgi:hypothetical protein